MHLVLDGGGRIIRTGPTLRKLRPEAHCAGDRVFDLFDLIRPRGVCDMAGLRGAPGGTLRMKFRDAPHTAFKGILVPQPGGHAVVNLSFGISILDAVRDYDLTAADFAATDFAIELLYLVEAKTAAMEESRNLNRRLQGARIAAEEQAFTDTLTGLKNRRAMDHVMTRLPGGPADYALMHLDLDFFKAVNDTFGHAAGDYVLQEAARIMISETREEDTVARIGGDEFVLMFRLPTDRDRLAAIADRLIRRLQAPIRFGDQICHVSASIGIAIAGQDAETPADLLHRADLALYAAKRAGRGRHRFFRPAMLEDVTDETPDGRTMMATSPG